MKDKNGSELALEDTVTLTGTVVRMQSETTGTQKESTQVDIVGIGVKDANGNTRQYTFEAALLEKQ